MALLKHAPAVLAFAFGAWSVRGEHGEAGACSVETPSTCSTPHEEAADVSLLQKVGARTQVSTDDVDLRPGKPSRGRGATTSTERCSAVGAKAWVSEMGVKTILDQITPALMQRLLKINLPEMHGTESGFKYSITRITISKLDMDPPAVEFVANRGVYIRLKKFHIICSIHYSFEAESDLVPLWTSGWVQASMKNGDDETAANVDLGFDGNGRPEAGLQVAKVNLALNGGLDFEGTVFEPLLELFTKLFQTQVEDLIADQVRTTVQDATNHAVGVVLGGLNMHPKLPAPLDNVNADVSMCMLEIGPDYFGLGVLGSCFEENTDDMAKKGHALESMKLDAKPPKSYQEHMLTLMGTNNTINSCLMVSHLQQALQFVVKPSDLPIKSRLDFSAKTAQHLVPNLKMPRDLMSKFEVHISTIEEVPRVYFDQSKIFFDASVKFQLCWCPDSGEEGEPCFLAFKAPMKAEAHIRVAEGAAQETIEAHMETISVTPIHFIEDGAETDANIAGVDILARAVVDEVIKPLVNTLVEDGIGTPNMHGMRFTNTQTTLADGYATVNADVAVDLAEFNRYVDSLVTAP